MKNIPLKTSLTLIAAAVAPFALAAPSDDVMHRASLAASAPAVPKFASREFKVEGNTLLDAAAVAAAVNPFTGAERDFGDVQRAIEALEAAYKARGYGAVGVVLPEQVLESGTVLLRVVEGKLARVEVKGNQHFDTANVLASVPSLQVGAVPDVESISASLRVANENPAKKVTLQLAPGDKDGDIEAKLDVADRKPTQFGITLDNTGTDQTGKLRLGLSFQHANLFNRDQILTLQYQTNPEEPSDVSVYAVAYRWPLYGLGDVIDVYATRSDVDAGLISAGPFNLAITGRGTTIGAKYALKLRRRGDLDHELVFGIDRKSFENGISLSGAQLGNKLEVHPLSVQYNARWGSGERQWTGSASFLQNIPGGSRGQQEDFDAVRLGADKDYNLVRGSVSFSQALAQDWQARLAFAAQYSESGLVPGEQFGVGGANTVRGFNEREASSDQGWLGNVEFYTPELCAPRFATQQCRLVAFYDWGTVHRNNPQPSDIAREHLSSIGIGMRWTLGKDLALQADYANVLQGSSLTESGDWKLHARLGWFF